jgi:hypothetical protein
LKGFPNQIAELPKVATGVRCLLEIEHAGENGKDDGVFGEALVRAGVAGTGHRPRPVESYLREQRTKTASNQSFRTTARGLRELYRLMGLIDDSGATLVVTPLGRAAANFAGQPMDQAQINFWRRVIRGIEHIDGNGASHPYQVLLRLVAQRPGISRAKCALALEANNDSSGELKRIAALALQSEDDIIENIQVTRANWDNAKKVLPRFAEQLGDVLRRTDGTYVLADAPGRAADVGAAAGASEHPRPRTRRATVPRAPRSSREVTPETIGMAGIAEKSDEIALLPVGNPEAAAAAIRARAVRLRRHNVVVRAFAALFTAAGASIYEDPFDILAIFESAGVLVEVKTLDGSQPDERERVRDALGQLLYYEGFLTAAVAGGAAILKIACFEQRISDAHRAWLNDHRVAVVWKENDEFVGDDLASDFLGPYLSEFE